MAQVLVSYIGDGSSYITAVLIILGIENSTPLIDLAKSPSSLTLPDLEWLNTIPMVVKILLCMA